MLPLAYYKLDYIESTNTQYINTGVFLGDQVYFEMECATTRPEIYPQMFLGAPADVGTSGAHCGIILGSSYNPIFHLAWNKKSPSTSFVADSDYHVFKAHDGVVAIDDVSIAMGSQTVYLVSNILLFRGSYSSNNTYNSYMRLKSCKIWDENDNLVRDFIPVLRRSDKKPGLYDLVNDVFYTNQGSGEFQYELKANCRYKSNGTWKYATALIKKNGTWKTATPAVKDGTWKQS